MELISVKTELLPSKYCDAIVIGSGAAGLYCALRLKQVGLDVCVLTKSTSDMCSTNFAQGGVAVALPEKDSPDNHFHDTVKAGAGLVNEKTALILVEEGVKRVIDLLRMGVNFDVDENGLLKFTREAAHSLPRIVYSKDRTGAEIERVLLSEYEGEIIEFAKVKELIVRGGRCYGVVYEKDGVLRKVYAPVVAIATGGASALYLRHSNPQTSTGDGIAIALRHGAVLSDLEFVQFHPTAFCSDNACFLISESVRGEGAVLIDEHGRRFMGDYHPDWELAPRDIVTRAIESQRRICRGDVYLDFRPIIKRGIDIKKRFPTIVGKLLENGIDPGKEPVPVSPVAHYYIGGIRVDTFGRTNIKGLFAIGEAACTGVHGANRLASNSLLECLVFGERTAYGMFRDLRFLSLDFEEIDIELRDMEKNEKEFDFEEVKKIMWENVGIVRDASSLTKAIEVLSGIAKSSSSWEVRNSAILGVAIAVSAMRREESRGGHYRKDFPYEREEFRFHSTFNLYDLENTI